MGDGDGTCRERALRLPDREEDVGQPHERRRHLHQRPLRAKLGYANSTWAQNLHDAGIRLGLWFGLGARGSLANRVYTRDFLQSIRLLTALIMRTDGRVVCIAPY